MSFYEFYLYIVHIDTNLFEKSCTIIMHCLDSRITFGNIYTDILYIVIDLTVLIFIYFSVSIIVSVTHT